MTTALITAVAIIQVIGLIWTNGVVHRLDKIEARMRSHDNLLHTIERADDNE